MKSPAHSFPGWIVVTAKGRMLEETVANKPHRAIAYFCDAKAWDRWRAQGYELRRVEVRLVD